MTDFYSYKIQDVDAKATPIIRKAQTSKIALDMASKDYPNIEFIILDSYLVCENYS